MAYLMKNNIYSLNKYLLNINSVPDMSLAKHMGTLVNKANNSVFKNTPVALIFSLGAAGGKQRTHHGNK